MDSFIDELTAEHAVGRLEEGATGVFADPPYSLFIGHHDMDHFASPDSSTLCSHSGAG